MKLGRLSKKTRYMMATIIGVVLVLLGTYSFIDAYKQNDNFKIFMRGLLLLIWTIYAITYAVLYRKETRSRSS
jgi:uncharacterized membrane protein